MEKQEIIIKLDELGFENFQFDIICEYKHIDQFNWKIFIDEDTLTTKLWINDNMTYDEIFDYNQLKILLIKDIISIPTDDFYIRIGDILTNNK